MFCLRVRFPDPASPAISAAAPTPATSTTPISPPAHRNLAREIPLLTHRPLCLPCPRPPPRTDLRRGRHPATVLGPSSASGSPWHGLHSFAPLAAAVLGHLRASGARAGARRGQDEVRVPTRPPRRPRRRPAVGARVPVPAVARGAVVRL
jgi:hypothetical protein